MDHTVNPDLIFHMCREDEWCEAQARGAYEGSSQDKADGFIHFSSGAQLRGSAAKHRAGQDGLVLLSVDPGKLSTGALKWEASRNNQLFPHLYGTLPIAAVVRADPLTLGDDGLHIFPDALGIPAEMDT